MRDSLLPWAIAAIASVVAIVSLAAPRGDEAPKPPVGAPSDTSGDEALRFRRQLVSLQSEASALRAELDRMRRLLEMKRTTEARDAETGEDGLGPEAKKERAQEALVRLDDLVARLRQDPTEEVYKGLQGVLHDLFRSPMDDSSFFEEKYAAATDPITRSMILPHLAARQGENLQPFIAAELEKTADPGLRADLITQLRVHSMPEDDPVARNMLLDAVLEEADPRARQIAAEGLAAVNDPAVRDVLLQVAAGDPDPATREGVIRRLAEAPDTRERVLQMIAEEPNERLRTVAECAATLAASPDGG